MRYTVYTVETINFLQFIKMINIKENKTMCIDEKEIKSEQITTPNQRFGQSLVKQASKEHENNRRNIIVSRVTGYMETIQKSNVIIEQYQALVGFNKRKIAALEAGEFTLFPHSGRLVFNDKDLNESFEMINEGREWLRLD